MFNFLFKQPKNRKHIPRISHDIIFNPEKIIYPKLHEWRIEFNQSQFEKFIKKHTRKIALSFFIVIVCFIWYSQHATASVTTLNASSCLGGWENSSLAAGVPQVKNNNLEDKEMLN